MKTKKWTALLLTGMLGVSMLTGCGINKNAVVASMQGQEVTLGLASFMCKYQQAQSDDMYRSWFGDEVWNGDLFGSGSTMAESMREEVMQELHNMYTLYAHQSDYKVELTEDENKAITDAAKKFMDANEEATIREMGATQEIVEEFLRLYTVKQSMYEQIIKEADTNISDEEANMRAYSMVEVALDQETDEEGNQKVYSPEESAEIKKRAQEFATRVKNGAKLEDTAKEYGYECTENTYAKDDDVLAKEVKEALDALKEGEVSALVTTDTSAYVLRLDSETDKEATEEHKANILTERQVECFNKKLEEWQKDDGWKVKENQLKKIEFDSRLTQENPDKKDDDSTETVEDGSEIEGTEVEENEGTQKDAE